MKQFYLLEGLDKDLKIQQICTPGQFAKPSIDFSNYWYLQSICTC